MRATSDPTLGPREQWPRPEAPPQRSGGREDRLFGRLAVVSASATIVLLGAGLVVSPADARAGLFVIGALATAVVVVGAWFIRRGISARLFLTAGTCLMGLGVLAGAVLPDGLDAAAVMPLAGAMLVIPVVRGRLLFVMFVLAFGASMAGETAAYAVGGMTHLVGLVSPPLSLAESAVMIAFTYGLVWWVSNQWRLASAQSDMAIASQRQVLALNERLLATLDPQKVLELIADSLKSVVAFDNLTIYRVDEDSAVLRPVLARDRFAALILESTVAVGRGITGWVVTHGDAQCVNDAHEDPRSSVIPGTPAESESLIVVPLKVDGRVTGTLNVGRMGGSEAHFKPSEFEVTQLFAMQASLALKNAEAHRAVSTRAETDALTGLLNRGAFEAQLGALVHDQSAQPLTLIMLDLDAFKAFNDRKGHPAGDALLVGVARAIGSGVRADDRVFRYGGDEFAALLPDTSAETGLAVAERIRAAIALLGGESGPAVTASVGVASDPDGKLTRDALVGSADAALYQAKERGGNRVAGAGGLAWHQPETTHAPDGSLAVAGTPHPPA